MTTVINRMQNFGVVEYLEWIRQVLGQSVYNQIMQLSPNILNFGKVITLKEQYLYGSKRLGVRKPHVQLATAPHGAVDYQTPNEPQAPGGWFNNDCMCYTYEEPVPVGGTPPPPANTTFTARFYTHTLGKKEYEITNHLGNVLATVLDRKTGVKASPTATTYAWFKADVSTAQDYYPFGSLMPGRTYVAPTGAGYRFGFNGFEIEHAMNSSGTSYNMGERIYNSSLARAFSIDPLFRDFPSESNYSFAGNSPITMVDENGEKKTYYITLIAKDGSKSTLVVVNKYEVETKVVEKRQSIGVPGKTLYTSPFYTQVTTYDLIQNITIDQNKGTVTVGKTRTSTERSNSEVIRNMEDDIEEFQQGFLELLGQLDDASNGGGGIIFTSSIGQGGESRSGGKASAVVNIDLLLDVIGAASAAASNPRQHEFLEGFRAGVDASGILSTVKGDQLWKCDYCDQTINKLEDHAGPFKKVK